MILENSWKCFWIANTPHKQQPGKIIKTKTQGVQVKRIINLHSKKHWTSQVNPVELYIPSLAIQTRRWPFKPIGTFSHFWNYSIFHRCSFKYSIGNINHAVICLWKFSHFINILKPPGFFPIKYYWDWNTLILCAFLSIIFSVVW